MNRIVGITAAVLFVFGIIFLTFNERVTVEDVNWYSSNNPFSDHPQDISTFYNVLKLQYPDARFVHHYKDTTLSEIKSTGNLYIHPSSYFGSYDAADIYPIREWVTNGNHAVFIGSSVYIDQFEHIEFSQMGNREDSILQLDFCYDRKDMLTYRHHYGTFDSLNSDYFLYHTPSTEHSDSLRYYDITHESLITSEDSVIWFNKYGYGDGFFYQHRLPELFYNATTFQDIYEDHLVYFFSQLPKDPDVVVFDHSLFENYSGRSASPIRFILENRSLRWAYYVLLTGILLYIIFNGKRKQSPIPVFKKSENTTIEYAETLATLYASQNQNVYLVKHLEDLFYHYVRRNYFIAKTDGDFAEKLARKSKVPLQKINAILSHFRSVENKSDINDDQLGLIYGRLEDFYNQKI